MSVRVRPQSALGRVVPSRHYDFLFNPRTLSISSGNPEVQIFLGSNERLGACLLQTNCNITLHLNMVPRSRLVPDHRPLLELGSIILQEKRKPEIRRRRAISVAGTEEHSAVGRIVVR